MKKKGIISGCAALVILWMSMSASAQEMTEVERLSFGTFAVADNSMPQTLMVTPDNDTLADTGIAIGQGGQRGVYDFTGLPPNVSFFIDVDVPNPPSDGGIVFDDEANLTFGGGEQFTVTDFTIGDAGVMQTDGAGNATMTLGATLRTSGNGARYTGGNYNGQVLFVLYY